jgi:glycosyltransferase involved in cell wall biosynthesis
VSTSIALHIAKCNNFDFMVRIDADGQHPTQNVSKILDKIILENNDMCIGQRLNNESLDTFRDVIATLVKKYVNCLSNLVTGSQIKDWSSGFFSLNKRAIQELSEFDYARYPEVELCLNAHHLGLKISLFNIEQSNRIHGFSTLTFVQSLRLLIRFHLLLARQIIRRMT